MRADLIDLSHPLFWTVDDVLSPSECAALIRRVDAAGPVVAPITRADGPKVDLGTRNNERVIFDDALLAARLFERSRPHAPARLSGLDLVSANERIRCYRYAVGQRFAPHYDGAFVRSDDERSLLTFMVYLNHGFDGGRTAFLDLDKEVEPRAGRALLFQHFILHEGRAVTAGVKYALRTDLMYRRS
jgi:prolyl 4-hydroxylase